MLPASSGLEFFTVLFFLVIFDLEWKFKVILWCVWS